MARMRVVKNFPYSADGLTHRVMTEGEIAEIRDDILPGLKAAGLVADVKAAPAAEANPAPDKAAKPAR